MNQSIVKLTEEFYKASIVVIEQIDTSRAVIPVGRTLDQHIEDRINQFASMTSINLRAELHGEIDKAKAELDAMQAERKAMEQQRNELNRECDAVRDARKMLNAELVSARADHRAIAELYNRVCASSGLCTPSRQQITGR